MKEKAKNINNNKPSLEGDFPRKLFSFAVCFTVLVIIGLGWFSYSSYTVIKDLKDRYLRIEELRGKIVHLDEVLTMSARMAVATGDLSWEERYHSFEPSLDAAIKEAIALSPDIYSSNTSKQTDEANIKLVAMENEAFSLLKNGKPDQARAVLFGENYKNQKELYAEGMEKLNTLIHDDVTESLERETKKSRVAIIAFVLVFLLLIYIWAFILKTLNNWQKILVEKNKVLKEKSEELIELNKDLDQKVLFRTDELSKANTELEQKIIEQKKLEEELMISNKELLESERASRNMLLDLQKAHDEIKQAQTQILQSEKLASIGQLAAGVAHEINNPVGFISNNVEVLEEYIGDYTKILQIIENLKKAVEENDIEKSKAIVNELNEFEKEINLDYVMSDVNKLLEHSNRGIERIKKIVMDLRTFAREDTDAMDLVKIEEVIDSIISIVHNELKYKAELKKDYGETPLIKCNSQRVGQVFINLLVNATHAIEEKGEIGIKTYENNRYVCVDINDTGKGIEESNLKKIFDAFYTTKPIGEGTGLGLSVSYEIIKKHGGDITVKSQVGEGTTFTVMLPISGEKSN